MLKGNTKELCKQLQDNPDVEGNQREIKRHKNDLIQWMEDLNRELEGNQFMVFATNIHDELKKQNEYETLRKEEKRLNQEIKKVQDEHRSAAEDNAKEAHEKTKEIAEQKKLLNESEVEKNLHIQYLER